MRRTRRAYISALQAKALCALDTINYLDSAQRACHPSHTVVDSLKSLVSHAWPNADEMTMLKQLFQYHKLNSEQLPSIAALYAITHLSDQVRMFESTSDNRLTNRCRNVVALISKLPQ